MFWLLATLVAVPVLYGLHRVCVRLEDDGYLHYRKKSTGSSGGTMFLPLDQIMRPQIQHVIHVEELHEKVTQEKDGDRPAPDFPAPPSVP